MNSNKAENPKGIETVEDVLKSYAEGKLLFPRPLLENLDRQLACGRDYVYINDLNDVPRKYKLTTLTDCGHVAIHWKSLQSLTILQPSKLGEHQVIELSPVSISFREQREPPSQNLDETIRTFKYHRREWQKSDTCISLKHHFETTIFSIHIKKIVCFGLGPLGYPSATRAYVQHALVETMAEVLKEKGGCEITCFAQDPVYSDFDKEFLRIIGITPVNDPKGFLEVDSKTLVVSASPNVPVRQIIADVQHPAAMLWNTVRPEPEKEKKREWEKTTMFGTDAYLSPYSTDPDSPRLRNMVQNYHQQQLLDPENNFGDLTIYIKK